jgi:hypothetical protein
MVHGAGTLSTLLRNAGHCVLRLIWRHVGPTCLDDLRSFTDYTEPLTRTMISIPPG